MSKRKEMTGQRRELPRWEKDPVQSLDIMGKRRVMTRWAEELVWMQVQVRWKGEALQTGMMGWTVADIRGGGKGCQEKQGRQRYKKCKQL